MQQQGVQPSAVLYNTAISACIPGGDHAVAVQLLEQMRSSSSSATAAAPDKFSYASAIAACLEPAAWRTALQLLADMRSEGIVPGVQAYGGAVTCLCKAGKRALCSNAYSCVVCYISCGIADNCHSRDSSALYCALCVDADLYTLHVQSVTLH
jgi:pentatricopeptide repeat protein